jgi:hypothetical protein
MNRRLSRNDLMALMTYEQETGVLTWKRKMNNNGADAGSCVGNIDKRGYRRFKLFGVNYSAHRVIWLFVNGEWPSGEIDHINGVRADNRFGNLRDCSKAQNLWNQGKQKTNKVGLKGCRITNLLENGTRK